MIRRRLLFVTNLARDDHAEDLYLADRLSATWALTMTGPLEAAAVATTGLFDTCLIRNAWPSKDAGLALSAISALGESGQLATYNPLTRRRRGAIGDKAYLAGLFAAGYPVVPTWLHPGQMALAGYAGTTRVLCRPLQSGDSQAVQETELAALDEAIGGRHIIQPKLAIDHGVSFFFIDGRFSYSLKTAGPEPEQRWKMSEFQPTDAQISWAAQFVRWNGLPFGVQRIDGACLADGRLLLMDIEDFMPFLSLLDMTRQTRERVTAELMRSLQENLTRVRCEDEGAVPYGDPTC